MYSAPTFDGQSTERLKHLMINLVGTAGLDIDRLAPIDKST